MCCRALRVEKNDDAQTMIRPETRNLHVVDALERRTNQHGCEDGTRAGHVQPHLISVADASERHQTDAMRKKFVRVARGVDVDANRVRSLGRHVAHQAATHRVAKPDPSGEPKRRSGLQHVPGDEHGSQSN